MSARRIGLLAALLALSVALADDDAVPDQEFLEYLGFWQGSDEEWLIFGEPEEQHADTGGDAPKEESVETEDES